METKREIRPPSVRYKRGEIERLTETIKDSNGAISQPFRAVDTLARMERAGTINSVMRQAGEKFREDFYRATLNPLHCADLSRTKVDNAARGEIGPGVIAARDQIWNATQHLGGIAALTSSCAWHVLGEHQTLKEWAVTKGWAGKPLHPHTASGILIGSLSALAAHYNLIQCTNCFDTGVPLNIAK